jgi:ribosomal protein S18 acetylase RimI-like enzyme
MIYWLVDKGTFTQTFIFAIMNFSNTSIALATATDIPALEQLLNAAYRGESSKAGWTTEANLISGDTRVNETMLREVIENSDSVMLIYLHAGLLAACVNLQRHQQRLYLGMFAVAPHLQGRGVGKILLQAAEEYAYMQGYKSIYMTVISVRYELIAWYQKHGYAFTGDVKPFEEDGVTGKHLQTLEFIVLEKLLN